MRSRSAVRMAGVAVVAVLWATWGSGAEAIPEQATPLTTRRVQLYKNGVAVIQQFIPTAAPGVYRVDGFPQPIHGTLSAKASAPVSLRMARVEVAEELTSGVSMTEALIGREVTVVLRDNGGTIKGTLAPLPKPKRFEQTWQDPYRQYAVYPPVPSGMIVLYTADGVEMLDAGQISRISAAGAKTIKREKPVLLVTTTGKEGKEGQANADTELTYLARGLSWAPSYRVDVLGERRLGIEQTAVIKNELTDLKDTEVELISGFPGIRYAHVISPLSLDTAWATFFRSLGQSPASLADFMSNAMAQQAVMRSEDPIPSLPGEGTDLHYQPIGRVSLPTGQSLQLSVARAEADCERVVEWHVPDTTGQQERSRTGRTEEARNDDDDPWEVLQFANPFKFPMTTAPASVFEKGGFSGQQLSSWANPGERTSLRVTKALSIRTTSSALEEPGNRENLQIDGYAYYRATLKGKVSVANRKPTPVKMIIYRQFSGELVEADAAPQVKLREEGVASVNRRQELIWQFTLAPGEEKELGYRYSVLVRR